jgi:hypothetical protein
MPPSFSNLAVPEGGRTPPRSPPAGTNPYRHSRRAPAYRRSGFRQKAAFFCEVKWAAGWIDQALADQRTLWDNPIVTVTADSRKRIILAEARPGEQFDIQATAKGVFLVRRLEPVEPAPLVKARKVSGRWVGANVKLNPAAVVEAIRQDREAR